MLKMTNCDKVSDTPVLGERLPVDGTGQVWTMASLQEAFNLGRGKSGRRQTERLVLRHQLLPRPLTLATLAQQVDGFRGIVAEALIAQIRRRRGKPIFLQHATTPCGVEFIFGNDARGSWHWIFKTEGQTQADFLTLALEAFVKAWHRPLLVFADGNPLRDPLLPLLNQLSPIPQGITLALPAYREPVSFATPPTKKPRDGSPPAKTLSVPNHLNLLEGEAIHIIREVTAETTKPVMLYSLGKDSSVMLHLALKAFAPAKPPFPLMHIDTGWKFRAMIDFRDSIAATTGMELITHKNPRNTNPFTHGASLHTQIMKTEALKHALDAHGFTAAFGGARRDEEKSRAKERILSIRNAHHQWQPKNQRPELWSLYNTRLGQGQSLRVFPLSNWTEVDIWQYILREQIPLVPLYFARPRPVVQRGNTLIMVDDDRMMLEEGEDIAIKSVRFRSLGCYPLTGAVASTADSTEAIIAELLEAEHSERQTRIIDLDAEDSMEDKKRAGYF